MLTQSYPEIEYLVMDGGSTDETVAILREYAGRLTWVSEPDCGQSHAINKGWRQGRGEILAWLNSDDIYLPGAVMTAVSYLLQHPDAGAVFGEGYHIDEAGTVLEPYPTEPFDVNRLRDTCYICQPTVFVRRAVIEQVGYVDESLQFCMDYDLWIRLGKRTRFGQVPGFLAATRLYAGTKTVGRQRDVYAEVIPMIYRHFRCVPPKWLYAFAKAEAEAANSRKTLSDQARFFRRLLSVGLRAFLRYNRRVPMAELIRWCRTVPRDWRLMTDRH